jgi:hypothetical protein
MISSIRSLFIAFLAVLAVSLPASAAIVTDKSAIGELTFWNSIKESANPEDIKTYIDEFPNGMFIDPAVARYEQMTGKRLASLPAQDAVTESAGSETKKSQALPVSKKKYVAKKKTVTKKKVTSVVRAKPVRKKLAAVRPVTCKNGIVRYGKCIAKLPARKKTILKAGGDSDSGGSGGGSNSDGGGGWQ